MKVLELSTWTEMFSPEEMDSDKVQEYLDFIVQAVERYDESRYSEWHHVMPKCIDEGKYRDEGVRINGADHFRAHMKLVECFKTSYYRSKLSAALSYVSGKKSNIPVMTPEEYERVRQLRKEAWEGRSRPNQNDGKVWINNGEVEKFIHSNLIDDFISQGYVRGRLSKMYNEEYRRHMSQIKKRENLTEDTRRKLRESHLDEKNSNYGGKSFTPEVRKKISERATGRRYGFTRHYTLTCRNCHRVFDSICPSSKLCKICKGEDLVEEVYE